MRIWRIGMLALCLALAALPAWAKDWAYRDDLTIHMDDAHISMASGMQVLEFTATRINGDTRIEYKYVYNLGARTIQIKEMRKYTKDVQYKSSFSPVSIDNPNPVIRERVEMAQAVYEALTQH